MKPLHVLGLLILLGLAAACQEAPTENESAFGSLIGEVRDRTTGSLLGKARVMAAGNGMADTTDFPGLIWWENGIATWWDTVGTFFLDSLSTGLDTVIVSRELYYTQEYLIDIAPDTNKVTFYLDPLCPYDTLVIQGDIKEMQFVRILGQWYLPPAIRGEGFEVINTRIAVKFKQDVSQEAIEAFNAAMGVQILRTNIDGSYDCRILDGSDPLCITLAYYASGLIEYAYPDMWAILL